MTITNLLCLFIFGVGWLLTIGLSTSSRSTLSSSSTTYMFYFSVCIILWPTCSNCYLNAFFLIDVWFGASERGRDNNSWGPQELPHGKYLLWHILQPWQVPRAWTERSFCQRKGKLPYLQTGLKIFKECPVIFVNNEE